MSIRSEDDQGENWTGREGFMVRKVVASCNCPDF